MIGRLRGTLVEKQAPQLIIELSNGMGYELETSLTTFESLPELGQEVILYTHQSIREDAHLLYGFLEALERRLFRSLIKVNGVGPKLALAILSGFSTQTLVQCVQQKDTVSLVAIPGVGKKTAERLMIELKDRLSDVLPTHSTQSIALTAHTLQRNTSQEALSALVALGYKPQVASQLLASLDVTTLSVEELVKAALQEASRI